MSFLDQDYEIPSNGSANYLSLVDGTNRLRILSKPILGWEDWQEKKPIRYKMGQQPRHSIDPDHPMKHFWAMIVWSYNTNSIQIWQIRQATIQKALKGYADLPSWGAPYYYDIAIVKSGQAQLTKYQVMPEPHSQAAEHIVKAYHDKPCWLDAMLTCEDPWKEQVGDPTEGIFGERPKSSVPTQAMANDVQLAELRKILSECEPGYEDKLLAKLAAPPYNAAGFAKASMQTMNKIIQAAKAAQLEYQSSLYQQEQGVPF